LSPSESRVETSEAAGDIRDPSAFFERLDRILVPEIARMHLHRAPILAALIAVFVIHPAAAQSKRGTWTGTSITQQGTQPFTIVLDSSASGWKGAAVAPQTTSDSLRLVDVSVRADTLEFGIPVNGTTVYVSGLVAGEKFTAQIWMQNTSVGSVVLTRKPAPSP
jgi:hypothetical protein